MNKIKHFNKYVFLIALIGFLAIFTGCQAKPKVPIQVTGITVAGAAEATTVNYGETLQMSAAVLPTNASNMSVIWSVTNGSGSATISATGLLTPTGIGTITVNALANDASDIEGTLEITVNEGPILAINKTIAGVSVPVIGTTPVGSITETAQYTGTVTWDPTDSLFVAATAYTATITLTPKTGYTIDGVAANFFTVADATATNPSNSGIITAVFPATEAPLAFVNLKTAGNYVILAQTTVTTTGTTDITGDLGLSPAAESFYTGFNQTDATTDATSTLVKGKLYASDMTSPTPANLTTATGDMITAYNDAAGRASPTETNFLSGNIGGSTLTSGLYKWTSTVTIDSDLTLTGSANDVWIFQIANQLSLATGTKVLLADGATWDNVFWQVAGGAILGTTSHMEGTILSLTYIHLQNGSSINGRLLAQTAVTLDAATIVAPQVL